MRFHSWLFATFAAAMVFAQEPESQLWDDPIITDGYDIFNDPNDEDLVWTTSNLDIADLNASPPSCLTEEKVNLQWWSRRIRARDALFCSPEESSPVPLKKEDVPDLNQLQQQFYDIFRKPEPDPLQRLPAGLPNLESVNQCPVSFPWHLCCKSKIPGVPVLGLPVFDSYHFCTPRMFCLICHKYWLVFLKPRWLVLVFPCPAFEVCCAGIATETLTPQPGLSGDRGVDCYEVRNGQPIAP